MTNDWSRDPTLFLSSFLTNSVHENDYGKQRCSAPLQLQRTRIWFNRDKVAFAPEDLQNRSLLRKHKAIRL